MRPYKILLYDLCRVVRYPLKNQVANENGISFGIPLVHFGTSLVTPEFSCPRMSTVWPPIETVIAEKRHELVLYGKQLESLLASSGNVVDPTLYTLTEVNYLKLANSKLELVDEKIGQLVQMQNLVLHQNALSSVPSSIGSMEYLKLLDLSGNRLTELPESIINLPSLHTLELSHNKLTALKNVSGMKNIHEFIITGNQLEVMPDGLEECEHLHTIRADHNQLKELPSSLHEIMQLKELNISGNRLSALPPSLVACIKLKVLDVRDNPYSDRKLLKLSKVDQTAPKPITRFLQPLYDKMKSSGAVNKKKGSNKRAANITSDSDEEDELVESLKVVHFHGEASSSVEIRYFPTVAEVRPHIVCCILRNIDFTQSSTLFKQFIALQTRLHEEICEKRLVATIATHDLSVIKSPLIYEAANPKITQLIPLGKQKEVTASDFMNKLRKEAEDARKAKKRNTVSGIHKYLDLLKDKPAYPFLKDSQEAVISFPPITNCESTKIKDSTTDILIEVTSSKSLSICKQVVEQIIIESHRLKISTNKQQLVVEQVKVTDPEGILKTVYPSRADLTETPLTVIRE